jgi:hypothetical protein
MSGRIMPRFLPKPGPLALGVGLRFEFVGELIELVEIEPGPEAESVRNGLRRRVRTRRRLFAQTGAERPVDHILERQPELARTPLQQAGQIIIDCERGAHGRHQRCARL